ncbi:PadR family transcriptional regulator [Microbacterium halotolerans]|uniref:PadR family transcriptional regulator n=1 Tax=Microbacterium halotolerans TaxID=246613 RepID=UPI000E6AB64C|nr:helix-turn-helix transcriptional regulator [Microbacterium halotolerans]
MNEEFDAHLQELRRGTIVLACLRLLREPGYGYGLLEQLTRHGFETDANTLYPLLRRLEKQGHLVSEWSTAQARPRKFYRTSDEGERLADALTLDWAALTSSIASLDDASESSATPDTTDDTSARRDTPIDKEH